jgi:hypothetical protein
MNPDIITREYADAADCAAHMADDDATIRATAGWDVISCELDYVGSYGAPPSAATPLRATWRLVPAPPAPSKKKG